MTNHTHIYSSRVKFEMFVSFIVYFLTLETQAMDHSESYTLYPNVICVKLINVGSCVQGMHGQSRMDIYYTSARKQMQQCLSIAKQLLEDIIWLHVSLQ